MADPKADVECVLCLDPLWGEAGGEEGGQPTALALRCGHVYHERCVEPWARLRGTCPTCRAAVRDPAEDLAPPAPPTVSVRADYHAASLRACRAAAADCMEAPGPLLWTAMIAALVLAIVAWAFAFPYGGGRDPAWFVVAVVATMPVAAFFGPLALGGVALLAIHCLVAVLNVVSPRRRTPRPDDAMTPV